MIIAAATPVACFECVCVHSCTRVFYNLSCVHCCRPRRFGNAHILLFFKFEIMHRAKSTPVVSRIEQIRVLVLSNIFSNLYQSVDTSMIEYNKLESVFGWSIFTLFIKKVVICLFALLFIIYVFKDKLD